LRRRGRHAGVQARHLIAQRFDLPAQLVHLPAQCTAAEEAENRENRRNDDNQPQQADNEDDQTFQRDPRNLSAGGDGLFRVSLEWLQPCGDDALYIHARGLPNQTGQLVDREPTPLAAGPVHEEA
jgi:hypothetical protein